MDHADEATSRGEGGEQNTWAILAMAFEVKSEACKTVLGKEDKGSLEGPADVVVVAMDHADEATSRRGGCLLVIWLDGSGRAQT
ncbi:hypothetical protein I3843_11G088700 [Carya illinoinensis]|uniref:Uncharacterized protein n=1 Tax=Carya illinoinensis TaxID=32201 RepID=A0A922IZT4_CARIL|nr:hypothetical protein I3842_11G089200 [Carya illinoinensis]KAG7955766.1 hypothetical protein I3843_11G088700 [Carya illinoinensis]